MDAAPVKNDVKTEQLTALNGLLDDFFERQTKQSQLVSPYYQDLWKEMQRLVQSGGKRLRPRMTLLAYQAFGGQEMGEALPIAAAQELLHLSMLIHDDVIDRDYVRYGVDNVAGAYQKHYEELVPDPSDRLHYANSAAILAGDLLISGAYQIMLESTAAPTKILEIQKLLGRSIFEVAGGELIDTEAAFRAAGSIHSETVALYKTASYTFISPLLIGAVLAGASADDQTMMKLFAKNLGIAFQLRDDVIGVFGNEADTGKSTIGDIREGKRTYLVEQFYKYANEDDLATFDLYFGNRSIGVEEAEIVKELLIHTGAREKTEDAIRHYEANAREALGSLGVDEDYRRQLDDLIVIATKRDR